MIRTDLLHEAADLVDGVRNAEYGEPTQDFTRTAAMWSAFLDTPVKSSDVAVMMILLKCSRIAWSPDKRDHWLDISGYAACGWDCANEESNSAG